MTQTPLDPAAAARLQADYEALQFECEMLRRETSRLMSLNLALEARVALAEGERDRLKSYMKLVEGSRPWRAIQTMRGWFGRRW